MLKRCAKCGEAKPLECFSSRRRERDGLRKECRQCTSALYRDWYERNADAQRERMRVNAAARRADGRCAAYEAESTIDWRQWRQSWAQRNRERALDAANRRNDELVDSVVRGRISRSVGIPGRLIPTGLIEAERLRLQIHRLLKGRYQ